MGAGSWLLETCVARRFGIRLDDGSFHCVTSFRILVGGPGQVQGKHILHAGGPGEATRLGLGVGSASFSVQGWPDLLLRAAV